MSIVADNVSFSYRHDRPVLHAVSLEAHGGGTTFVLGANGSGKTTLLSCLAGILAPDAGTILIDGQPLAAVSPRMRAQTIGFVPQLHTPVFAYTVWEVVLMGRAPHLPLLARPGHRDRDAAAQAIRTVGLWPLRDRPYTEISGGERRLVLIARGLAQGVRYLLLDEPDAHLDPAYQHHTMTTLTELGHTSDVGIIASSHQPNNALLYADQAIVLGTGHVIAHGPPSITVVPAILNNAYGMEFELIASATGRRAVVPATRSSKTP